MSEAVVTNLGPCDCCGGGGETDCAYTIVAVLGWDLGPDFLNLDLYARAICVSGPCFNAFPVPADWPHSNGVAYYDNAADGFHSLSGTSVNLDRDAGGSAFRPSPPETISGGASMTAGGVHQYGFWYAQREFPAGTVTGVTTTITVTNTSATRHLTVNGVDVAPGGTWVGTTIADAGVGVDVIGWTTPTLVVIQCGGAS